MNPLQCEIGGVDLFSGHEVELHITNLGKIKEATLDIRPLTVFVGPDHTNKTWAAYALYGLANNLARLEFSLIRGRGFSASEALQAKVESDADRLYRKLVERPASEVTASISREQVIREILSSELSHTLDARGLSAVLNLPESMLDGAKISLIHSQDEFRRSVYSDLEVTYKLAELDLEWNFIKKDAIAQRQPYTVRLSLPRGSSPNGSPSETEIALKRHIVAAVEKLAYTLYDDAAVLPTERKALLSLDRPDAFRATMADGAGALAAPIHDFLYMADAARSLWNEPGSRPDFSVQAAALLEEKIIKGTINFEEPDPFESGSPASPAAGPRRARSSRLGSLVYSSDDVVGLPIHAAASIVRSLAGLDMYLRLFCDRGGFLVIDEPEMNAHPEAQLKIIELLAMLAHQGVHVALTTHSPYIVDHLTNLMQAARLSEKAQRNVAPQFLLGNPAAFLPADHVSVYLFNESGVVDDILDRGDGVIDWTTFSRHSEYVVNLVNEIWKASDHEVNETMEQKSAV